MCGVCVNTMSKKNLGLTAIPNFACPICKQIGKYFRYKKPIFS